jgi:transcriptional regulatory protein RtcR
MATLAQAGRVTEAIVAEEIERLRGGWHTPAAGDAVSVVLGAKAQELDLFDRCQLNTVIETCRSAISLSEAGRKLFSASRKEKKLANDADRLRKYLARFSLSFDELR